MGGTSVNRSYYFNYIEEKLSSLSYRIKNRGRINLLDLNIYSESFFASLLNKLFNYKLKNMNVTKQNIEGIDLIDEDSRIIVQVSSTCTKQKIESALAMKIFAAYPNYHFRFVAIAGEAKNLRNNQFQNPSNVNFSPEDDILDITSLLSLILNMEINNQRNIYEFIKDELGEIVDMVKVDTNLATIINIISKEALSEIVESPEINSFEIFRKIEVNDLLTVQNTIDDYKVYYSKLDEKYKEFDKQGVNKSFSVLSVIRKQYNDLTLNIRNPHDVFYTVIDKVIEIVMKSKNYIEIPYEELEMCVSILVVDAFIRCKIFKNPEGYQYAVTR